MKNEKTKLPGCPSLSDLHIFDEEIIMSMLDNLTAVRYNGGMNDETHSDLPACPTCGSEMEWHPNGHIASCTSCGHEEIL